MDNQEKELSFREGMIYVFAHWKSLIVGLVIGALLLGGFGYYKDNKAAKANTGKVTEESLNEKLAELYPEAEVYLRRAIEQYREYMTLQDWYANNYVAQMDVNKVSAIELVFYADVDYTINYNKDNVADPSASIVEAYRMYADGGEVIDYVVEKLEGKIPEENMQYLISTSSTATTTEDSNVFTVYVRAADKESCEVMAAAIKEKLVDYTKTLSNTISAHELVLVNEMYSCGPNTAITNVKTTMKNSVDSASRANDTFSTAIKKMGANYYSIYGEGKTLVNGDASDEEETAKVSINKKYVVVGALGGAIAVAAVFFLVFALAKTVNNADEVSSLTDSFNFGTISAYKNGISKKRLRLTTDDTTESTTQYVTDTLAAYCEKNGITEVYATGTLFDGTKENEVLDLVKEMLSKKNITVVSGNAVNKDASSLKALIDAKAVVIFETIDESNRHDILKESGICKKNNVNVIGNITVF